MEAQEQGAVRESSEKECELMRSEVLEHKVARESLEMLCETWRGVEKMCDELRDELGRVRREHACSLTMANDSLLRAECRIQQLQHTLDETSEELVREREVVACLSALRNSIIAEDFKEELPLLREPVADGLLSLNLDLSLGALGGGGGGSGGMGDRAGVSGDKAEMLVVKEGLRKFLCQIEGVLDDSEKVGFRLNLL